MRKFAYSIVVSCCFAGFAFADDDAPPAGEQGSTVVDRTVTIDGRELKLAYEAEADGDTIQEFIPAEESLEKWTRLAAVREYSELNNPLEVVQAIVKDLAGLKPSANAELMQNPKNGAVVLSFTVWSEDKSFVEYNVFEYCRRPEGGLVSYQYAIRAYGDEAEPFAKSLDADTRAAFFVDAIEFANSQGKGVAEGLTDAGNGYQIQKFEPINARSSESTSDEPMSDDTSDASTTDDAASSDSTYSDDSTNDGDSSSNDEQRRDDPND